MNSTRGIVEPALAVLRAEERRREAHRDDRDQQGRRSQMRRQPARVFLHLALGLPVQPAGAEQGIAGDHARAGQQAERRQPVPPAAAIGAAFDRDALQQRAERDPLRERRDQRARGEAEIPDVPVAGIAPAEFERDAAEHEAEQHRDQRRVERGHHDRISEREGGEQPAAAEHQPGFVAVPDRRDRIHRGVALAADPKTGNRMPMPRSNPSITTYMNTAKASMTAQTLVSRCFHHATSLRRRAARRARARA